MPATAALSPAPAWALAVAVWTLLAAAAAAAVGLWTLQLSWLGRRGKQQQQQQASAAARLPPGSFGWPVVGETLDFVSCAYSPRPESFVDKRRARHGGPVFRSHLFGSATVVTSDAEVSRFVLQSDARAFVPWYPRSLTELMGKSSILLINGSLQRRVHGLVGAFFKSPQLKARVTAGMQRRLAPAIDAWRRQGPGALVRIQDHAKAVRALPACSAPSSATAVLVPSST
jgi:steroid 3-oxidase